MNGTSKGDLDALIVHGLNALRDTLQQDKELSTLNTSIVRHHSLYLNS